MTTRALLLVLPVMLWAGCGSTIRADFDGTTDADDETGGDPANDHGGDAAGESEGDPAVDAGGLCTVDAECDDGDACTGDSCDDGTCTYVALHCEDGNPCTDDACDPSVGCVFPDNAAPCDDGDPCTQPDACSAGSCRPGPSLPEWYRDADHDGVGTDREAVCAESPPGGYVAGDGDCCDSHGDVFPGQSGFFDLAYTCGSYHESWDYDCDGTDEPRWEDLGECWIDHYGRCRATRGWDVSFGWGVPWCGEWGMWIESCEWMYPGGWCGPGEMWDRIQECR